MGELIEHQAVVRAIQGDRMTVRVNASECSSCGHGSGCAINRLTRREEGGTLLDLPTLAEVRVGDVLNLSLSESSMGLYALLGYLVPALAFLLGAVLGNQLTGTDFGVAMGAIAGFIVSLLFTRVVTPLIKPLQPTVSIETSRWVETP